MNIDNALGVGCDNEWFENLHIACQNQEIYLARNTLQYPLLILRSAHSLHRKMQKRDSIHASERLQLYVIADDKGNIHRQLAALPAPEQVSKTMIEPGDEDRHPFALPRIMRTPTHAKSLRNRPKRFDQLRLLQCKVVLGETDT